MYYRGLVRNEILKFIPALELENIYGVLYGPKVTYIVWILNFVYLRPSIHMYSLLRLKKTNPERLDIAFEVIQSYIHLATICIYTQK